MRLNNEVTKTSLFQSFLESMDWIAKRTWFEGQIGFGSMILNESDIWATIIDSYNPKEIKLPFAVPHLSQQIIVIPRADIPLRTMGASQSKLHQRIGIIKMNFKGNGYRILWGLAENAPISKFIYQILLAHNERLSVNPDHRVLAYCFPQNLETQAMLANDVEAFSQKLYHAHPNLLVWMPDGIACQELIAPLLKTDADSWLPKLKHSSSLIFIGQGYLVSGNTWNDVITILENTEKAAWKLSQWPDHYEFEWPKDYAQNLTKIYGFDTKIEIVNTKQKKVKE